MATYSEQMQMLADRYVKETGRTAYTTREVAAWAIKQKLWEPQPSQLVRQCAEELARALREQYVKDPQGRRVRAKHFAVFDNDGEQIPLWADIRSASYEHIERAFQLRRQQIVGDCRQLKTDVDSYNQNYNTSGEQLHIIFDFSEDLEESEFLTTRV